MMMNSIDVQQAGGGVFSMPALVLGTCYFGLTVPKELAFQMMDVYRAAGGNMLDTARGYCNWLPDGDSCSERTVGQYIQDRNCRSEVLVCTKGCVQDVPGSDENRVTREGLLYDMDMSLRTLGTDYVDLYLVHRDHRNASIPEVMETLHGFVKEGKCRSIGASNWRFDRIEEANRYAAAHGLTPFTVSQLQWSLADCTPEDYGDNTIWCMTAEELARYAKSDIRVMGYSSQAKGLFSKMIAGGRAGTSERALKRFYHGENIARVERVRTQAAKDGVSPAAVALGYITSHPLGAAAIIGPTKMEQLTDSLTAADYRLDRPTVEWLYTGQ